MGSIRLACRFCDSHDYDFVESLPTDWFDIQEVQSYQDSLRQVTRSVNERSVFDWYTHLGVCPECYEAEIAPPILTKDVL